MDSAQPGRRGATAQRATAGAATHIGRWTRRRCGARGSCSPSAQCCSRRRPRTQRVRCNTAAGREQQGAERHQPVDQQRKAQRRKRRWRSHRHDEHRAGFAARGGTRRAAASGGGERSSGQRAPSRARGGGCTRATRRSRMAGKRRAQIELETARLRRPPGLDLLLERGHRGVHRLVEALAHTLHRVLKPTPQGAQRSAEEHSSIA